MRSKVKPNKMPDKTEPKEVEKSRGKKEEEEELWASIWDGDKAEVKKSELCIPSYTFERYIEGYNVPSSELGTVCCAEENCDFKTHRIIQLRNHLVYAHNFKLRSWTNYFEDRDQFTNWKNDYLNKNPHLTLYPVNSSKTGGSRKHYYCGLGKKTIVMNGKRRISNVCTSTLRVTYNQQNSSMFAELIVDHYGHDNNEPILLPQKNHKVDERDYLNSLVRSGAPKEDFITLCTISKHNEKSRKEISKEFDRLKFELMYKNCENYLTEESKVDIWNSLITSFGENSIYAHKSAKDKEVLLRMPPEIDSHLLHDTNGFDKDDFYVIYMSESQKRLILRNMKLYVLHITQPDHKKFTLFQLFVLNSFRSVSPVSFCFSSAEVSATLSYYFTFLKLACGDIKPSILMCNTFSDAFSLWNKVFGHPDEIVTEDESSDLPPGPIHFITPWFVDDEFHKKLSMCNLDEKSFSAINKEFLKLRQCDSYSMFHQLKIKFITTLNCAETRPLFDFIIKHFMSNPRRWSMYYVKEFTEEIQIMNDFFTELNLKRFARFTSRKIGKCVKFVLEYQTIADTTKKRHEARRPGKQKNPVVETPALNRLQSLRAPKGDDNVPDTSSNPTVTGKRTYPFTQDHVKRLNTLMHQYKAVLHKAPRKVRMQMRRTLTQLSQEIKEKKKSKGNPELTDEKKKTESYNRKNPSVMRFPRNSRTTQNPSPPKEASAVVPTKWRLTAAEGPAKKSDAKAEAEHEESSSDLP